MIYAKDHALATTTTTASVTMERNYLELVLKTI